MKASSPKSCGVSIHKWRANRYPPGHGPANIFLAERNTFEI
jgi:hypothetical protein